MSKSKAFRDRLQRQAIYNQKFKIFSAKRFEISGNNAAAAVLKFLAYLIPFLESVSIRKSSHSVRDLTFSCSVLLTFFFYESSFRH